MKMRLKFPNVALVFSSLISLSPGFSQNAETKPGRGPEPVIVFNPNRKPVPSGKYAPISIKNSLVGRLSLSPFAFKGLVRKIDYSQSVGKDNSVWPMAYVTFDIQDWLKGKSSQSSVVLAIPFGPLPDGSVLRASGVPIFQEGDNIVMFLDKNGTEANPVSDENILFIHEDNVYTRESHPLLQSLDQNIFLGKSEHLDSILTRNPKIEGFEFKVEASELPEQDEAGLSKTNYSTFKRIVSQGLELPGFRRAFS